MINIISTFGDRPVTSGPGKVFANLVKGFEKIGYPYVVNRDLNATKRVWIHDTISALYSLSKSHAFKVVGPNLFVLPNEISSLIDFHESLYLQPSEWAKQIWDYAGFNACPIDVWPVGIDTEMFYPLMNSVSNRRVLIYHKQRDLGELHQILDIMEILHLPYTLIRYGEYEEENYLKALRNASFLIWHGCHESQGIALQEALACNVPILVCDVTSLSQAENGYRFPIILDDIPVTAAPYFDDNCGIKITNLSELKLSIGFMLDNLTTFTPREYILKNLSLERQARAFVALWDKWNLTFEQGLFETTQGERMWKAPLSTRVLSNLERKVHSLLSRSN